MKIWSILKGFWTHTKKKLVENQMHNESGMLWAALVRVASNGFTSVLVPNTQCVLAGIPTHCEPQGFYCVCKVFCSQGSIPISLWEVTILSHSHSPAPKCQANIFLDNIVLKCLVLKIDIWVADLSDIKKNQWICLGVSTEALKFLKWPYTHFWQFELCICAQQNSQHWWL